MKRLFLIAAIVLASFFSPVFASGHNGLSLGAYCKWDNIGKWRFGFDEGHRFGHFLSDFNLGVNSSFGKFNISYSIGAAIVERGPFMLGVLAGGDFNASFKDIRNNMDVAVKAEVLGTLHVSSHLDFNLRAGLGCNFDIANKGRSFVYGAQISVTCLLFTQNSGQVPVVEKDKSGEVKAAEEPVEENPRT